MEENCCCPSVYPISSPQNVAHPFQAHPQQHMFLQEQEQQEQVQQQHFPPFQQLEESLHRQIQGPPYQHPLFSVNFKLGLNENSCSGTQEGALTQQQGAATLLHGNQYNLPHSLVMPHSWQPQDDSIAVKQHFWKLLNRSNNGEQESEGKDQSRYSKPLLGQEVDGSGERCKNLEKKYRLFGELEAIYSHAKTGESNQAGSGSALTHENSPTNAAISVPFNATQTQNFSFNAAIGVDHGSENSIGEEVSLRKSRKRKRKRKMKEKLSSMVGFFQNLVKQVVDHQEMLHRKFLEVIERMEKERAEKEEAWRHQEAEKHNREAMSRAHEQALASSREAQIVSYIEKITGQSINLPARNPPLLLQPEDARESFKELTGIKTDNQSRWPKAEVEALIQFRSSIENKFQEPGLKGPPLWEEVSSLMGSMGYHRSARRCKEKWENINKYFKKSKESTKKRSQQSKTCSYFDQLDQLYSRTIIPSPSNTLSSLPLCSSEGRGMEKQGYAAELLEAFVAGRRIATSTSNCNLLENGIAGTGCSSGLQFNGSVDENAEPEAGTHQPEKQDSNDKDADEGHNHVGGDGNDKEIVGIEIN